MPTSNPLQKLNVTLPDDKAVVKQLDEYHKALELLQPVVNKYHAAFGGLEDIQAGISKAKDAIIKAKTTLSS